MTYALQLNGDKRDPIDGHLGDLLCPRCGFDCTHIDAVDVVTAAGNAVSVEASGEDQHGRLEILHKRRGTRSRRHAITLRGTCENGCQFSIELLQHKGATEVTLRSFPSPGQVRDAERSAQLAELGRRCESAPEQMYWQAWSNFAASHDNYFDALCPQVAVGKYRLDFGNPDIKFGVEIDGLAYHNGQDSFMRDRARQRALEADGWRIIRFAAKEVLNDPQKCFEETFWALRNARA